MVGIDLVGLTNALTDITFKVSDEEIAHLGLKKGGWYSLNEINIQRFTRMFASKNPKYYVGGSPANTIINASILGLNTGLFGSVGNDTQGDIYLGQIKKHNIEQFLKINEGSTGVCYILVSPEGERTCIPSIGVAGKLSLPFDNLRKAKFFHTSGYELETDPRSALEAINHAKYIGAKVSFDMADASSVKNQQTNLDKILPSVDILFTTEEEAKERTGYRGQRAIDELARICPIVAYKKGPKGAIVRQGREQHTIKAYDVKKKNTCGAGDAFAAGFLYAHIKDMPLEECGHFGSFTASRVCNRNESNLSRN
ncbi:adenosine kinase [Candidatus Pacearchaeota archaeon]|nr:adenosine kinase [Candidatus Pacearchaeota archaeon]